MKLLYKIHKKHLINAALGAAFILFSGCLSAQSLSSLLPKSNEIHSWKLADSSVHYVGDQLYNYIDGGAEIFMEYGFKQVVSAPYTDSTGRQIQVEIYEMAGSDAAYGIYTFYLNGVGEELKVDQEGYFLDYYGVFWEANMVCMVSTPGGDTSLKNVIQSFSKNISQKYPFTAPKPALITKIENSAIYTSHIKYLKGRVGLSNIYKFIPGNAFTFNEGLAFSIKDTKVIIFKYENYQQAAQNLKDATEKIKSSNTDINVAISSDMLKFEDYKGNIILGKISDHYIIIQIAKDSGVFETNYSKLQKILQVQ